MYNIDPTLCWTKRGGGGGSLIPTHVSLLFSSYLLVDRNSHMIKCPYVHYQHDTAGLTEAGVITAIRERTAVVHTKKKSIHKFTGRRPPFERMFDGSLVSTTKGQ